MPYGESRMGLGIEEFVADAIILLRRSELEGGRTIRELNILKMRGTLTPEMRAIFSLKDGFQVFSKFKAERIEKPSRFQPQPNTEKFFSTGSPSLDEMLGGGYLRGSTVLIEIDEHITTGQYHLITDPTVWNFLARGRGVMGLPSAGVDPSLVLRSALEGGLTMDEINRLLRVCVKVSPELRPEPYLVTFEGKSLSEDLEKYLRVEREIRERTGQPILHITGVDLVADIYVVRETILAIKNYISKMRESGDLNIILLKPGYPRLAKILGAIAETHLRIIRAHGLVLVYGVKPRTNLYVLEMDTSRGYAMPKLTPIV